MVLSKVLVAVAPVDEVVHLELAAVMAQETFLVMMEQPTQAQVEAVEIRHTALITVAQV